jgi:hypothetical protein
LARAPPKQVPRLPHLLVLFLSRPAHYFSCALPPQQSPPRARRNAAAARREIGARALAAFFSAPLPRASLVRWRSERRSLLALIGVLDDTRS